MTDVEAELLEMVRYQRELLTERNAAIAERDRKIEELTGMLRRLQDAKAAAPPVTPERDSPGPAQELPQAPQPSAYDVELEKVQKHFRFLEQTGQLSAPRRLGRFA